MDVPTLRTSIPSEESGPFCPFPSLPLSLSLSPSPCLSLSRLRSDSRALAADAAGELHVFGHDGDALGVDGIEVAVLKEVDEVILRRLLEGNDRRGLEANGFALVGCEVLCDLSDKTLEGDLAHQKLRAPLVLPDFPECHGSGFPMALLLYGFRVRCDWLAAVAGNFRCEHLAPLGRERLDRRLLCAHHETRKCVERESGEGAEGSVRRCSRRRALLAAEGSGTTQDLALLSMGLDAELTLVRAWYLAGRATYPVKVDGWPLTRQQMHVVEWCKNHWVHGLLCMMYPEANECKEVCLTSKELRELANKLESWVDDPEAIPPCPESFFGPFFGIRPGEAEYEEVRDAYRDDAKDEAATIRKAADWIDAQERQYARRTNFDPITCAIYKASW